MLLIKVLLIINIINASIINKSITVPYTLKVSYWCCDIHRTTAGCSLWNLNDFLITLNYFLITLNYLYTMLPVALAMQVIVELGIPAGTAGDIMAEG